MNETKSVMLGTVVPPWAEQMGPWALWGSVKAGGSCETGCRQNGLGWLHTEWNELGCRDYQFWSGRARKH